METITIGQYTIQYNNFMDGWFVLNVLKNTKRKFTLRSREKFTLEQVLELLFEKAAMRTSSF